MREKPKGSARVMWSFRPREGGESTERCEVCREREKKKFGKVFLIRGERVSGIKEAYFICFALEQYLVLIPSTVQLCKNFIYYERPDGSVFWMNFVNNDIYYS